MSCATVQPIVAAACPATKCTLKKLLLCVAFFGGCAGNFAELQRLEQEMEQMGLSSETPALLRESSSQSLFSSRPNSARKSGGNRRISETSVGYAGAPRGSTYGGGNMSAAQRLANDEELAQVCKGNPLDWGAEGPIS